MKKPLAFVLILLLCVACMAEGGGMLELTKARGFDIDVADRDGGGILCDLTLSSDGSAVLVWTDAAHRYTVGGQGTALSALYLDALALGGWESCRYIEGEVARLSYGADSDHRCDSLGAYTSQVQTALTLTDFVNRLIGVTRDYVLNKRSKKFHYPDCPGIRDMNLRNREDYTGTRDAVIAMGYSPCGICKP